MRLWPGSPFPLGATYDGTGTNFAVFSEVADAVELCLFEPTAPRRASRCPSGPRWSGTATRRTSARASATGSGSTARSSPPPGCAAIPPSCCWTPTRRPSRARCDWDEAMFTYRFEDPDGPVNDLDSAPAHAQGRGDEPVLRLGARPPAAHALERDGRLRGAREGLHAAPSGHPRGAARHLRGARPSGRARVPARRSASRRWSCCRCTSSSRTPTSSSAGCATTGATTRSASWRRTTATAPRARPAARCRSSSRWSRRCTRRASR